MFHVPEEKRVTRGPHASDASYGNNGKFYLNIGKAHLQIIASDGCGWEHVSVSLADRCPTWEEMCKIKDIFWDETDTVIQYHPPKSRYVNIHPYCLHLWRTTDQQIPVPPMPLV